MPVPDVAQLEDYIPLRQAEREFGFARKSLRTWCELGHPLLGKPLGHVTAGGSLQPSRSDLLVLQQILAEPLHKLLPGNRGVWIADVAADESGRKTGGLYRDGDGSLWYSAAYLRAHHGIDHYLPRYWERSRAPGLDLADNRARLIGQEVLWPSVTMPHGGLVTVYPDRQVFQILKYRGVDIGQSAVAQGRWIYEGKWRVDKAVWRDAEGDWFTDLKARRAFRLLNDRMVYYWQDRVHPALGRAIRRKQVFKPFTGKGGGRAGINVTQQEDLASIVAWSNQQMPQLREPPGPGWKTAVELAEVIGLTGDVNRQTAFWTLLRLGREAEAFRFVRIRRDGEGNRKWACWCYEVESFLAATASKRFADLIVEWGQQQTTRLDESSEEQGPPTLQEAEHVGGRDPLPADPHPVVDAASAERQDKWGAAVVEQLVKLVDLVEIVVSAQASGSETPSPEASLNGQSEDSPSRGGRPPSKQTAEVQEFCYRGYMDPKQKVSSVLAGCKSHFGESRAPKDETHVRLYAQRYAKKHGLLFQTRA